MARHQKSARAGTINMLFILLGLIVFHYNFFQISWTWIIENIIFLRYVICKMELTGVTFQVSTWIQYFCKSNSELKFFKAQIYILGHWNLILCLASPALVMKIVPRLIIKNPKKFIIYLNWSFLVVLIISRCFKSQEMVWNGQNMHSPCSHAKTATGVHQAVA